MRSNRPLTQFACRCVTDSVVDPNPKNYEHNRGNTTVRAVVDGLNQTIDVDLFGSTIMSLIVKDFAIHSIRLLFGGMYDQEGNPTSTTIERINGLLATLGQLHALPEGVRIFKHREEGCYAVGKDEDYVTIGRDRYRDVMLRPSKARFEVDGYMVSGDLLFWK